VTRRPPHDRAAHTIDLCAGPGGWEVAARHLGLHAVGVEVDPDACATRAAAGLDTVQADVLTLDRPSFIRYFGRLIASPPCQTFSTSGRGHGRRALAEVLNGVKELEAREEVSHAFDDVRTALVLEPLRWALEAVDLDLPFRSIILEQVPAVLPVWEAIADVLRREGYSVATGKLQAEQYGVPQTRTRAILVARLDGTATLPAPTHRPFVKGTDRAAGDPALLPWVSMREAMGWTSPGLVGFPCRDDREQSVTLDGVPCRARDFRDLNEPSFALTSKARPWLRFGMRGGGTEQLHRSTEHPAPTLAFGRDSASWCWADQYDKGVRVGVEKDRITLAEAGILQSFPADYPWTGRNRHSRFGQIANAVPPLLARAILAEVAAIEDPLR
jgi:DNA (cytosine-5)-methyltransferase 1